MKDLSKTTVESQAIINKFVLIVVDKDLNFILSLRLLKDNL